MLTQVDLSHANTLNLPCIAAKNITLEGEHELLEVCKRYSLNSSNTLFMGEGSNLILPPFLKQTVLSFKPKTPLEAVFIKEENHVSVVIEVEAGVQWDSFVEYCVNQGYNGLENLSLIPGTLGAAPIQNIGAYGVEVADCLEYVKVFSIDEQKINYYTLSECQFSYRDSIFKRNPGKFIVTGVCFRLSKLNNFTLEYGELTALKHQKNMTSAMIRKTVIATRQAKLPDPKILPNAGSFFKNPVVTAAQEANVKETYPLLVSYPLDTGRYKLAAAWLIDQAGWKGYRDKHVGVHDKQALVIVNHNGGTQSDILSLAEKIKESVFNKFKVMLEIEPVLIS